jgi:hypothetical protein
MIFLLASLRLVHVNYTESRRHDETDLISMLEMTLRGKLVIRQSFRRWDMMKSYMGLLLEANRDLLQGWKFCDEILRSQVLTLIRHDRSTR